MAATHPSMSARICLVSSLMLCWTGRRTQTHLTLVVASSATRLGRWPTGSGLLAGEDSVEVTPGCREQVADSHELIVVRAASEDLGRDHQVAHKVADFRQRRVRPLGAVRVAHDLA